MLMDRVRQVVGRIGQRLETWSRGEVWALEPQPHGFRLRRRSPCLFDDADTFAKFLYAAGAQKATHIQSTGVPHLWQASDPQAASTIANLGLRDRLSISITGGPIDAQWGLTFDRHGPSLRMGPMTEANIEYAREVTAVVDRFARPVRRMARDQPVVQPISMITAQQQAHDRKISRRSVIWGFIGGALAGPIVTGLVTWLVTTATATH